MSDYYRTLAWSLVANGDLMGLKISNIQVVILQELLERELESDPDNVELKEIHHRLIKMRAWREKTWSEDKSQWIDKPPTTKVWGRDYV